MKKIFKSFIVITLAAFAVDGRDIGSADPNETHFIQTMLDGDSVQFQYCKLDGSECEKLSRRPLLLDRLSSEIEKLHEKSKTGDREATEDLHYLYDDVLVASVVTDLPISKYKTELARILDRVEAAGFLSKAGIQTFELPGGRGFEISPVGTHPFNILAKKLLEDAAVKMHYDVRFMCQHPYAAASFDRKMHILFLPRSSIETGDAGDPTILHELVHVYIQRDLEQNKITPYHGFLSGEDFKPDDLYLDEMKAYANDLQLALSDLQKYLDSHSNSAVEISSVRLKEIFESRDKKLPRIQGLNFFETIWDRIVSKRNFGEWHTEPVINALETVLTGLENNEILPTYERREGVLRGVMKFESLSGRETNLLDLALPSKDMKAQVKLVLQTTNKHQSIWLHIRESLMSIIEAEDSNAILNGLQKLSKQWVVP